MAEDLCISNGSKAEKYRTLLPQIKSLIEGENDLIANLANVSAALKETFGFFWGGILSGERGRTGIGTFSGTDSLHTYPERTWCLRYGMG